MLKMPIGFDGIDFSHLSAAKSALGCPVQIRQVQDARSVSNMSLTSIDLSETSHQQCIEGSDQNESAHVESGKQTRIWDSLIASKSSLTGAQCRSTTIIRRSQGPISYSLEFKPLVALSIELLESLRGLPLPRAAQAVGVSATAFKKACRKLGIPRWGYRRGPGKADRMNPSPLRPSRSAAVTEERPQRFGPATEAGISLDERRTCGDEIDERLASAWLWDAEPAEWAVDEHKTVDDAVVLDMLARPWAMTRTATCVRKR